ncbi:MAG: peptidoglycan editing factor PgeF [Acidobacteria bacterium]|nr:peptidoglycan editing factor PgeF [Acidobacteriota bacterium]
MDTAGAWNRFSTRLDPKSNDSQDALNSATRQAALPLESDPIRTRLLRALSLPEATLVTLRQIHSDVVINLDGRGDVPALRSEGDALVTDRRDHALGILTADCVPLLIYDPVHAVIAAVHAGWRGTVRQISAKTVDAMGSSYATRPSDLLVAIGPAIRPCCYEVGSAVTEAVKSSSPKGDAWLSPHPVSGKAFLNLAAANADQLRASGVAPDRIFDCGLCTACRPDLFYSYRRDGDAPEKPSRMISIIAFRPKSSRAGAKPRRDP